MVLKNFFKIEHELMRKYVEEVGKKRIVITSLIVLALVFGIEVFASINIHLLHQVEHGPMVLRDIFSMIAVFVAAFTIIANLIFQGGLSEEDRKIHYYFRTRPLIVMSVVAVLGDVIAISLVHNTGYLYVVFFTSLIAINVLTIFFAIHSIEKAIRKDI